MSEATQEAITFKFNVPLRAAFMNAVDGRQFQGKGDPRHDATFIVEKENAEFLALKNLVISTAQKFFPGKKLVARRLTQEELDGGQHVEINVPWKDGTKAADEAKAKSPPRDMEFARGKILLKAGSKYRPALSVLGSSGIVDLNDDATVAANKNKFYAGAEYLVAVRLNPYKAQDNKPGGVGLFLNNLMFVKDGQRIGGQRASGAEVFKGYVGQATTENPTDGLGDEF